jgi:hypothetical protein
MPILPRIGISVLAHASLGVIGIGSGVENPFVEEKVSSKKSAVTVGRILAHFAQEFLKWARTACKHTSP